MLATLTVVLRRLAARPTFTVPALATLAVGVGATTALFTAVDATLLRPLPYPRSEDLRTLATVRTDGRWSRGTLSSADLIAIDSLAPSVLATAGAIRTTFVIVGADGGNRQVVVHAVTDGFFDLIGLPMAAGRAFTPEDPEEGLLGPAVLSYGLWQDFYGGDPEVVGRTLRFTAGPATIVGVAPPQLDVPPGTDVWIGVHASPTSTSEVYEAFVRVRPGTSPERLEDELAPVAAGLVEARPETAEGRVFVATPLVSALVGDLGPLLVMVLGAAAVLLALGCVNVVALMLAREGALTRELAIRKALGADRAAVLRHLLAESFVLSALGTTLGAVLAFAGVRVMIALGAGELPRLDEVVLDARVLLFCAVAMMATTLLVGLVPAVRLAAVDVRALMGRSGSAGGLGRGARKLLSALVVAEIACAIVLVAGAGWLVRSYGNLVRIDPGFVTEGRLAFTPNLLGSAYLPVTEIRHGADGPIMVPDRTRRTPEAWLRELTARLRGVDGFRAVGVGSALPMSPDPDPVVRIAVLGRPDDAGAGAESRLRTASPGFFAALGVRTVAGRTFTDADPPSSVVVNQAFARAHFRSARDALGASFAWGVPTVDDVNLRTVVGVVADVRYRSLREQGEPAFYQRGYPSRGTVVVSLARDDLDSAIPEVRDEARAVDASIPVGIEPLQAIVSGERMRHRLGLILMMAFAAVSLALAGIGIHGVVGHVVSLRSGELAVRMALGETRWGIARAVLATAPVLWATGVVLGVSAAWIGGRMAAGWLFEVRASDSRVLLGAAAAVSVLTLAAFLSRALGGSRIRPAEILKAS